MKKILILTLFFFLTSQAEEVVRISTLEWPPFASSFDSELNKSNILVQKIYEQVDTRSEFLFYPWSRALMLATSGAVDALAPEYYSEERSRDFYYSEPFYESPIVLVAKKEFPVDKYNSIEELSKYKFGVVKNYINCESIDSNAGLKKEDAINDLTNIKKLEAGRVDLIVIDKEVFNFLVQKEKLNPNLKIIYPILDTKKLYVVFPKNKMNSLHLKGQFNKGLKKLKLSDRDAHP